jgi:hypothetical protein
MLLDLNQFPFAVEIQKKKLELGLIPNCTVLAKMCDYAKENTIE